MTGAAVRAAALVLAMLLAAWAAHALKPSRALADELPAVHLAGQVPLSFAGWRVDESVQPVVPDPTLQARMASVYDQTIARTYVHDGGERVMLAVAYGRDQSSESTAVHRPEFCYGALGFRVRSDGVGQVPLAGGAVTVQRLVGTLGTRVEPISYWVTLADRATLPGLGRKLAQLRMGLSGAIADGMLVRVSSLGEPTEATYAAQARFLQDLADTLPTDVRARYFGA